MPTDCQAEIENRENTAVFTREDLLQFAESSHDYNPLHLDEAFAKTTVYGENVVFGMLAVTQAMKQFDFYPEDMKIQFVKPLFLGHVYTYHMHQKNNKPRISFQENGAAALEIISGGGYSEKEFNRCFFPEL